jgi:glycosyltransferase involved in cell wall biosynthesis
MKKLCRRYKEIKHARSERRLGKGGAVENGIKLAKGEKIAFLDLDLSTNLSALPELIGRLDEFDMVIGSRYHPAAKAKRVPLRWLLSRTYSVLVRILLGLPYRDIQCGFKAFRKEVASVFPLIRNKSFFWDAEFVFFAKRAGFGIREIPVEWHETKENITTTWMMVRNITKLFFRRLLNR